MNKEFVVLNIDGKKMNELLHILEEYRDSLSSDDKTKIKKVNNMIRTLENNARFFEETECFDEI